MIQFTQTHLPSRETVCNSLGQGAASAAAALSFSGSPQMAAASGLFGAVTGHEISWKKTALSAATFGVGHLLANTLPVPVDPTLAGNVLGTGLSLLLTHKETVNILSSVAFGGISKIVGVFHAGSFYLQGKTMIKDYAIEADYHHVKGNLPAHQEDLPESLKHLVIGTSNNHRQAVVDGQQTLERQTGYTLQAPKNAKYKKFALGALSIAENSFLVGFPAKAAAFGAFLLPAMHIRPSLSLERLQDNVVSWGQGAGIATLMKFLIRST